jgi:hypothetical protein
VNRSKSAITSAKSATASVRANPRIAIPNTSFLAAGFRPTAVTNDAKILPIPTPTPARAITAKPAPINFARQHLHHAPRAAQWIRS